MEAATQRNTEAEIEVDLGFSRPDEVIEDHDGRGLKRASTRPVDEAFTRQFEYQRCRLRDLCGPDLEQPGLNSMGFEAIDLSPKTELQTLLGQLRKAGEISRSQARELRHHLTGSVFPLANGSCLKMLFIAPEGLIMRTGGPNGLKIDPDIKMEEMNGHDVALAVHGDQDVRGTPLKQLMRGFAPTLFRHKTPDGSNRISPLVLVNLWIPLQQITRPLTLMDRRTLKAREHQLRYALPTDSFLDRSEDMRQNDIWAFLHDTSQQWYFHSQMSHDKAYIFDTLGEPHGSVILPGEAVAEQYYLQLHKISQQLLAGEEIEQPITSAVPLPPDTTVALRLAIEKMLVVTGAVPASGSTDSEVQSWLTRAAAAMDSVVRRSLEMRVVAVLMPNMWPFNRAVAG